MKKTVLILLICAMCFGLASCGYQKQDFTFKYWNEDSESMQVLKDYVKDVTDEKSSDFIPAEDRIAVFDMDGTLYCETAPNYIETLLFIERVLNTPGYNPTAELLEYAKDLKGRVESGTYDDDEIFPAMNATAFADMTITEYNDFINKFTERDVPGFSGLKYKDAWFLPMVEVVDYLNANGFKTFICSGTERATCRALVKGHVDIQSENIIGCDIEYKPDSYQGSLSEIYQYDLDDKVVRSVESTSKCLEGDKVNRIIIQIGKQPVLVFGNSLGDTSMAIFCTNNNPHKSAVFMLMGDDTERENGNTEKYNSRKDVWDSYGWTVFSMKDDFKTVFGDGVKKN